MNRVFETPDKTNAFFLAGTRITITDENPDYPALMFANFLLGQGINSRLFARIRGKEGLSYGISSALALSPADESAMFVTNAISAPENAAKVEASFKDEIATLLKNGFSDAEIAAGKVSWQQNQQLNREQNAALASESGQRRALRPDAGVDRRSREEGAGVDVAADLRGDAEVLRPGSDDGHEGRRFQEGGCKC